MKRLMNQDDAHARAMPISSATQPAAVFEIEFNGTGAFAVGSPVCDGANQLVIDATVLISLSASHVPQRDRRYFSVCWCPAGILRRRSTGNRFFKQWCSSACCR